MCVEESQIKEAHTKKTVQYAVSVKIDSRLENRFTVCMYVCSSYYISCSCLHRLADICLCTWCMNARRCRDCLHMINAQGGFQQKMRKKGKNSFCVERLQTNCILANLQPSWDFYCFRNFHVLEDENFCRVEAIANWICNTKANLMLFIVFANFFFLLYKMQNRASTELLHYGAIQKLGNAIVSFLDYTPFETPWEVFFNEA